jgi:hypothetical protein
MVPEGKARAGVPGGKNRKTLPGNLQILEAFQPQMPAIRVFDHDVVGGLNHEMHWDTQGVIPLLSGEVEARIVSVWRTGNGRKPDWEHALGSIRD